MTKVSVCVVSATTSDHKQYAISQMHYIHYVLCTTKSKWNALISSDKQAHQEINASANFINRYDVKHVHWEPSGLGSLGQGIPGHLRT